MIKKLFLAFFATLCVATSLQAQIIHKIMFGHTTDERIGPTVEVDMDRASNEIDAIGSYLNYEVKNYVYVADECSKENLERVLSSLSVSNKDIVVFYYSGHGGHANGGFEDKWPQMCLNKPPTPVHHTTDQTIATTSELDNALASLLAEPNRDRRVAQISTIVANYFSNSKVTVVSMGRNLTTPVDYEEAETFIRRMAIL